MDRVFFEELELPRPRYNLDVGSGSHAEQTGRIMVGVEEVLMKERPEVVLGSRGYQHCDGRRPGGFQAAH